MWEYALTHSKDFALISIVVCSCSAIVLCEFFKMVSRMHKTMMGQQYHYSGPVNLTPRKEQQPPC